MPNCTCLTVDWFKDDGSLLIFVPDCPIHGDIAPRIVILPERVEAVYTHEPKEAEAQG